MSTHKRKWAPTNSSQDWNSTIQSIELDNACLERNRVAPGNELPMPWPFNIIGGSEPATAIFNRIEGNVRNILQRYNIPYQRNRIQLLKRRQLNTDPKETVILCTTDDQSATEGLTSWWQAANEIQTLLDKEVRQAKYGRDIRVEIRNDDLMKRYITSVVPANTQAFELLTSMRSAVIEKVRESVRHGTISFVMRGNRNETKMPTVLIGVLPGTTMDWNFLYERVMDIVLTFTKGKIHVEVEMIPDIIAPGGSIECAPLMTVQVYRCQDGIPTVASIGASIGPRGASEAGSVGVWIYLTPPDGHRKIAFLTCYHVIRTGLQDEAQIRDSDKNGIGLDGRSVAGKDIIVDYPAPFDAIPTENFLRAEIAAGRLGTANVNRKILDTIERYRKYPGIGYVAYASGLQKKNNAGKSMDWAVVVFSGKNSGQNKPPPKSSLAPYLHTNNEDWSAFEYDVKPDEVVSAIATPVAKEWLLKKGRTTGITTGEYDGIQANVEWGLRDGVRVMTDEHVMRGSDIVQFVARGGDSGSMIMNQKKEWVGILTGTSTSVAAGYFTCARDIVDDIKEKTGCAITLLR